MCIACIEIQKSQMSLKQLKSAYSEIESKKEESEHDLEMKELLRQQISAAVWAQLLSDLP